MASRSLLTIAKKGFVLFIVNILFVFFAVTSSVAAFSIKDEKETGEKLLFQVRRAFPLLEEPDLVQYLNSLGHQVLKVAGPQYFHYRYFLINNNEYNAFAAPSGLIFFFTGLITKMNSEDELIAVLAHETAHVVKRHIATGMAKDAYANAAAIGLAILGATIGGSAAPALMTGALAAGQSVHLHYSREHEQEADLCAYEWMKKMGRNPVGELQMLKTMRRIARYRSEKLPQYLLTHPNPEQRMAIIESFLATEKGLTGKEHSDNFEFFRFKYRILSMVKEPQVARAYFTSVASRSDMSEQQQAMAQFGLSQLAWRQKDYSDALHRLEQVRVVFPDKVILAVDQGRIEADAGFEQQALHTLRQAVRKDHRNMYGVFTLGKLLKRMGRLNQAKELFLQVQSQLPEYPQVYFELGQIAAAQKKNAVAEYYLGKFNLYAGKLELAEKSFRRAAAMKGLSEKILLEIRELLAMITRIKRA